MQNYFELLKNRKWLRKRRNIILRDSNKCTVCGTDLFLRVHHTFYYDEYTMPWLYPNESLITLCENCHKKWHEQNEPVIKKKPKFKPRKIKKVIHRNLKGLKKFQIIYINKRGRESTMDVYAESELRAVYSNARKIKAVISVRRLKKCKG